jgi:hypothetical protein
METMLRLAVEVVSAGAVWSLYVRSLLEAMRL